MYQLKNQYNYWGVPTFWGCSPAPSACCGVPCGCSFPVNPCSPGTETCPVPIVPPPAPVAGADPNDPTGAGGGTIGTGQVSVPGEQGFTGNAQPQGTPQQVEGGGQQPQDLGTPQ